MTIKIFDKSDWPKVTDPVEDLPRIHDMSVYDRGVGITLEDDGKTIGCGGVVLHDDTVGELWLRISSEAKPLIAMTAIKAGIKILADSFPGVQLICRVKDNFSKGERLVQHLGFIKDHMEDNYWVYKCQIS